MLGTRPDGNLLEDEDKSNRVDERHLFLVGLGTTTATFFPFLVEEEDGRVMLESDSLGESGLTAFL